MSQEAVDLVRQIVKAVVDEPDKVTVNASLGNRTLLITLSTASPRETGLVIGKEGKTINAIRTIARCVAAKNSLKAMVEIVNDKKKSSSKSKSQRKPRLVGGTNEK